MSLAPHLQPSALVGESPRSVKPKKGAAIELGWPGFCPRKPRLVLPIFDDSGSVSLPGGGDPVGNRYEEAHDLFVQTLDHDPAPEPPAPPAGSQESLLDVAVDHLRGQGTPAHRVWLPPLGEPDPLDRLLGDLTSDPALGLVSPRWRALEKS